MGRLLLVDATCKFYEFLKYIVWLVAFFMCWYLYGDTYFRVEELRDSTAHAEMICIREASNLLRTWRLSVISYV